MTNPELDLTKPSVLKEILGRHGFSFKKQLGQNFLIDRITLERIGDAAEITDEDGVLEIGPGAGVVTRMLAARAKQVVTIEKDESLRPILGDTLADVRNVHIHYNDVLQVDLARVWSEFFSGCRQVSVVANLPYYVTTPILFHILESNVSVAKIVVMVQKEVADRMMAGPGTKDYGVLTVAVQYRAAVRKVTVVKPSSFMPPPTVDSTVVQLSCYQELPVAVQSERDFFHAVRAAFSMRRKTLLNALAGGLAISKQECQELLSAAGIDPNRRGETLSLSEFAQLANEFTARKAEQQR